LLQKEIDATLLHGLLIVLGDANAKVGSDNTGWEGSTGNEGLGTMNDNGLRFALRTVLSLETLVLSTKTSTSIGGHHQIATTEIRSIMWRSEKDSGDRYWMSEHSEEQTQQVTITLSDARYA